jgi:hypothetical protein
MPVENGLPTDQLAAAWRTSKAGNPSGSRAEVAAPPDAEIAVRDSRSPSRPAPIYTSAEIAAFVVGAKAGEFDDLA